MRWLGLTTAVGVALAITIASFFARLNATDPAYSQAAQPVICVSGCLASGGSVVVSGTVTANQGTAGGTPWPVSFTPPTLSTVACSALCANEIIKNTAGSLYSFNVSADSTLSGAAWWIMVYNATSAPSDGAVTPAKCYAMPNGTASYSAAFPNPVPLGTGIVIGVSTTGCFTKTASTHAFISGDYQ